MDTSVARRRARQSGSRRPTIKTSIATFEPLKSVIVEHFKKHDARSVVELLRSEHKVLLTERQVRYRCKQWRIHKYDKRKRGRKATEGPASPGSPALSEMSQALGPDLLSVIHDMPGTETTRATDDATMLDSRDILPGNSSFDFGAATLTSVAFDPATYNDARRKLAPDGFFAFGYTDVAFAHYMAVLEVDVWRLDVDVGVKRNLLICCARTAYNSEAACHTRKLIADFVGQHPDDAFVGSFLFKAIDLSLRVREEAAGTAAHQDTLQSLVGTSGDEDALVTSLSSNCSTIDLVVYHFLNLLLQELDAFARLSGLETPCSPEDVMQKFILAQPFVADLAPVANPDFWQGAMPGCLLWCRQKLSEKPAIPAALQRLQGNSNQLAWRDNIVLFGCLLQALFSSITDGCSPAWYESAERELGISGVELLVTITWRIGCSAMKTSFVAGPARAVATPADPVDIILRASCVADAVVEDPPAVIWHSFITMFADLNMTSSGSLDDPYEKAFDVAAASCIKKFITETLNAMSPALAGRLTDGVSSTTTDQTAFSLTMGSTSLKDSATTDFDFTSLLNDGIDGDFLFANQHRAACGEDATAAAGIAADGAYMSFAGAGCCPFPAFGSNNNGHHAGAGAA